MSKKIIKLVEVIKDKTERELLDWQLSGDEQYIYVVFGSNVVEIHQTKEPYSSDSGYLIRVTDGDHFVFDKASDVDLARSDNLRSANDYYTILDEIFTAGWRVAVGSDSIIDSILEDLDED